MGLGARWHEIANTYAEVNMAFGDIVKVTPSSKVVGDLALFLVSHKMTVEEFTALPAEHQFRCRTRWWICSRVRWDSRKGVGRNRSNR